MTYSGHLLRTGADYFVPFNDKISSFSQENSLKISKNEQKNRLKVAKAMEKAIQQGQLDDSFALPVQNMKASALQELSNSSYSNGTYLYDQIAKAAPILDVITPGLGVMAINAARVGNAQNIYRYASQAPSIKDTSMKIASFVAPILFAAASPIIMPTVTPYITTAAIITGSASVIGSALFLDAINYFKKR